MNSSSLDRLDGVIRWIQFIRWIRWNSLDELHVKRKVEPMGTEFGFSESYVGRLTFPSNKNLQLYYLSGYSEVSGGYCRRRGCCAANKLSIRNCISNCLKHTPQTHEIFFEQKSRVTIFLGLVLIMPCILWNLLKCRLKNEAYNNYPINLSSMQTSFSTFFFLCWKFVIFL